MRVIKLIATLILFVVGIVIINMFVPELVKSYGGLSPLKVIIPVPIVIGFIMWAIWIDENKTKK